MKFFSAFAYFCCILFVASVLTFFLATNSRNSPLDALCAQHTENRQTENCLDLPVVKLRVGEWHLDKPSFYFSIQAASEPDTIYRILDKSQKAAQLARLHHCGNWRYVQDFQLALMDIQRQIEQLKTQFPADSTRQLLDSLAYGVRQAGQETDLKQLQQLLQTSIFRLKSQPETKTLLPLFFTARGFFSAIQKDPQLKHKNYLPKFVWHGTLNQYHIWLSHFLLGDWGNSYRTGEKVTARIANHLPATLLFGILSFLLTIGLGIPLGVYKAVYAGSRFDKISTEIALFVNALPTFMIGIILLFVFANPQIFNIFAAQYHFQASWLKRGTLPLLVYSLGGIVGISQLVQANMEQILQQPFILAARAKGLPETRLIWLHAFNNCLLPLTYFVARFFPGLIAGSIVIELLFGIKGMGAEYLDAIHSADIPFVLAVQFLTAALSVFGYFIADLLARWVDKRLV